MDFSEELEYNLEECKLSESESADESSIFHKPDSSLQGFYETTHASTNEFSSRISAQEIIEDNPHIPPKQDLQHYSQGEYYGEPRDKQEKPKIEDLIIITEFIDEPKAPAMSNESQFVEEVKAVQSSLNSRFLEEPARYAKKNRSDEKKILGSFYREILSKKNKKANEKLEGIGEIAKIDQGKPTKSTLLGLKKQDLMTKVIRGHNKSIECAKENYFPTKGVSKIRQYAEKGTFDQNQVDCWKAFSKNYNSNKKILDDISQFRIKSENCKPTTQTEILDEFQIKSENSKSTTKTTNRKSCNIKFCKEYFNNPICVESFRLYIFYLFASVDINNVCCSGEVHSEDCSNKSQKIYSSSAYAEALFENFNYRCCNGTEHLALCSEKWIYLRDYLISLSFISATRSDTGRARTINHTFETHLNDRE